MMQAIVDWARHNPHRAAEGVRLVLIMLALFGVAFTDTQQLGVIAVVSFVLTEIANWKKKSTTEGEGGAA